MHLRNTLKIIGLFLMLFSVVMLPPAAVGLYYGDGAVNAFLASFAWIFLAGTFLWLPLRKHKVVLRTRDGFLVVTLFWTVLGLFGGLPFWLITDLNISLTDAFFEATSGLTTTGATVLVGLDTMPHAVNFYRALLHWLGGMGVVVLAVAVLPMLGVGGMQLYRAETPGPMKDAKLTPRIAETAKALWVIYFSLTLACVLAFMWAGMSGFDAVVHGFSALSTGGFSSHDKSLGYFNSVAIELIAVFFMLLGAINFSLHFVAWRNRSLRAYFMDSEIRTYLVLLLIISLIIALFLYFLGNYKTLDTAFRHALFTTVSLSTSTGFTTENFSVWPVFTPVLLMVVIMVGGCSGSTAGGIKVVRLIILFKQGLREIKRLIHPNAEIPIKLDGKAMPNRVLEAIWGFFAAYIAIFILMTLLLMATGLDQVTAYSAVAACIANAGPGLGKVALNYKDINDVAKWLLSFTMIIGRLEVFTFLVILSPAFWRR